MSVTPLATALHLKVREEEERRRGAEHANLVLSQLPAIRSLLTHEHGAKRVWLFGSLVHGTATPESDVDLAVEGLPSDNYFEALAALLSLLRCSVDLVCLEQAPESLRTLVLTEGREL